LGSLRLLLVEDSADDAGLLLRELRRGFDPVISHCVDCASDLEAALRRESWDLVITDFSLPRFSGPEALAVLKASGCDTPVIIVSGTVDEEAAILSLKSGANDFISKGRFARLVPAVVRELREAEKRRERARAIEALTESEDRHRLLFDSSPLPSYVFDLETRGFLDVNTAAVGHYGYTREEFLARKLDDLWLAEDVPARLAELASTASPPTALVARRQKKRDGTVIDVQIASHDLDRVGRRARLSVVTDVTDRNCLEAQLRQAQKVEAIGQLASGIAHDFNNILAVIMSFASVAADQLAAGSPVREDVDEISRAAERAGLLTRQLLAFSRREETNRPVLLALNECISRLGKMLRRTLIGKVELVTELAEDAGSVLADPGQVEQVVLNLALNARDAMPAGGTLFIRTRCEPAGDYAAISVTDTGTGMDEKTKARLFEPFFTTKPPGQGTGLGLATVFSIVRQSGGRIAVESAPGEGTTFTVYLPRSAA
jgi:two-component system cell cycle sensor histidine kinase/response regulator CckA